MPKHSFYLAAVIAVALIKTAFAAQPLEVKPWVYDPDRLGICESAWVPKQGLPDAGKSNHALHLTKMGPTGANAASGASITYPSGTILKELGFDERKDGHCGAGAPRFNVYTADGYYFFGCVYGLHTPAPDDPINWERVRFGNADAFPSAAGMPPFVFGTTVVTGIEIVFDEGLDQGPGFAYLDNIDINGTLIGKPGAAK